MKLTKVLVVMAALVLAGCPSEEDENDNSGGSTNDGSSWVDDDGCVDADGDGHFANCTGTNPKPDCDDDDADNWTSCAACADADGDGYFTGCDGYTMLQGPDCDDSDAAATTSCGGSSGGTCSYTPVPAQNPEPGILAGMTAEHNRWRARVGVAPLTWNSALAQSAAAYASSCVWAHDANRSPDAGFAYVGENLYAGSQQPSNQQMIEAVVAWADERYDYDYGTPIGQTGSAMVGHYTQMVWSATSEVGCGYARCQNPQGLSFDATIVVCRYGDGGNYVGMTPYGLANDACLDLDNDDVLQGVDADDTDRDIR